MVAIPTLSRRNDFVSAYKDGVHVSAKSLLVQAVPFSQLHNYIAETTNAFGFTVTKRLDKSAVARNRMKRRMRESLRELRVQSPALFTSNVAYVFVAKHALREREYVALQKDMRYCLHQVNEKLRA